jgi:hypothetical protein
MPHKQEMSSTTRLYRNMGILKTVVFMVDCDVNPNLDYWKTANGDDVGTQANGLTSAISGRFNVLGSS